MNLHILYFFQVVLIGPKRIMTQSWSTLKTQMNGNKLVQWRRLKDLMLFLLWDSKIILNIVSSVDSFHWKRAHEVLKKNRKVSMFQIQNKISQTIMSFILNLLNTGWSDHISEGFKKINKSSGIVKLRIRVRVRVRVRVEVKVKSQKSKLDPEVGFVMAWPTHPPGNFFWAENC